MDIGAKTGAAVLDQTIEVIVYTKDPTQHGNPRKAFGELKKA